MNKAIMFAGGGAALVVALFLAGFIISHKLDAAKTAKANQAQLEERSKIDESVDNASDARLRDILMRHH